jgi:hypothetical protein
MAKPKDGFNTMPAVAVLENAFIDDLQQVFAISAFHQGFGERPELLTADQTLTPGNKP